MSVFSANMVNLQMSATDKVDAIRQLAQLVVDAGRGTDVEQIVKDVLARDEMGTPQVEGVAIPHARTSGVQTASVAVARLTSGVEFDPEEGPATTLFMILVPDSASDEHIVILSGLARRLMNPEFTDFLRNASSAEELASVLGQGEDN
jgi:mannitol/fructose-specific phosphotransferase system IIA component (Ntr-type)